MTDGTIATQLPTLRFRLPGQWWQIPLGDRDQARESVRRLVRHRVGVADQHATLRSNFRRELFDLIDRAIDGGGLSMHIALDVIENVPLSASFTVFFPEQRMTPAIGTDPSGVLRVLEEGLRADRADELASASRFEIADSAVLRLHRNREIEAADHEGTQASLSVDYWITVPGSKRVVLVAFSTAFAELDDVMLTFFDSIIRVTWWDAETVD